MESATIERRYRDKVKSANDGVFTCSIFRKYMMDFVDDELSGKMRSDFLAHAFGCPQCERELKDFQQLKKLLANLTPVTASPEFDFRLKSRLSRENSLLQSPFYRMRLYISDNLQAFITVPAAAVILLAGFLFYSGNSSFQNSDPQFSSQITTEKDSSSDHQIVGSQGEEVFYVLDSIDPKDAGAGVVKRNASEARTTSNNTVTLISF
jgi:hypothetical protein